MKKQTKRTWRTGPQPLYPWGEWFGMRKPFTLRKGKDYHCKTSSMLVMLHQRAPKFGQRVSVLVRGDSLVVQVK